MPTLAIVVSTYNRPDALQAVLNGYLTQRDLDFELLVADDGSRDETRGVVERTRARATFPVRHVWHEDAGFRLAAIRNRALARTSAEYVVFTDGDCVPTRSLTRNQKRLATRGWFVSGSRVLLGEAVTERLLSTESTATPIHEWSPLGWLQARMRGDVNRLLPLLPLARDSSPSTSAAWNKCRGFSIAGWRSDFLAVNGFDESYEGWGLEDSDLAIRLLNHGLRLHHARRGLAVAHLWHPENPRDALDRNARLLDDLRASGRTRASRGLDEAVDSLRRSA